jgi:hypothetical protein
MRVYTLWQRESETDTDLPWCVDAVDEYTVDENELPKSYIEKRNNVHVRELILDIPEKAVRELFDAPVVKAAVVKE